MVEQMSKACCKKCKHAQMGIEQVIECEHPYNKAYCPVQGEETHKYNNYSLNGEGQCDWYEEGKPIPRKKIAWFF